MQTSFFTQHINLINVASFVVTSIIKCYQFRCYKWLSKAQKANGYTNILIRAKSPILTCELWGLFRVARKRYSGNKHALRVCSVRILLYLILSSLKIIFQNFIFYILVCKAFVFYNRSFLSSKFKCNMLFHKEYA